MAGVTTRGVLRHTPVNHTVFSYYATVGSIPHVIVFGMCHVAFNGMPLDYVVFYLAIQYAFWTM